MNVVRCSAFPEVLGDPGLCVCILDKVLASMEKALRIALNLESLDKSRDVELKAIADLTDHADKSKKDKYAKVSAQPRPVPIHTLARRAAAASSFIAA